MMRSLWTAASGMNSMQMNIDTIANNISNVNTTAFKRERLEFKSLLYQTLQRADLDPANLGGRPVNLQVGLGVRPAATSRLFTQGNLLQTQNNLDFAIEGPGLFAVRISEDEIRYTRDGSFKISVAEDGELMLVTSQGFPVLSTEEEPIIFPEADDFRLNTLSVDRDGNFTYIDSEGELQELDFQIAIVQFSNVQGLEAVGGNFFAATPASGEAIMEADGDTAQRSNLVQGYLEGSNVSVAEEMINMITTQRAFDLNSRVIHASDEMLQGAANLRR
ncbi:MAG: flagellar hook-basal body protein [Defluviitaleaceae bacterium]|nr:flagellar hook-basal body protein [Defluviitaleaceae bacterium]